MFDETFFQTSLPEHIKAKGTESADPPSVHVKLRNGQEYKIGRILEVSPQWVMCEVYPSDGKSPPSAFHNRPSRGLRPGVHLSALPSCLLSCLARPRSALLRGTLAGLPLRAGRAGSAVGAVWRWVGTTRERLQVRFPVVRIRSLWSFVAGKLEECSGGHVERTG